MTPLQQQSGALKAKLLKDLVPVGAVGKRWQTVMRRGLMRSKRRAWRSADG